MKDLAFEDKLATMDKEELLALMTKTVESATRYQFAEGPAWYEEREAREECNRRLGLVRVEMRRRGIHHSGHPPPIL